MQPNPELLQPEDWLRADAPLQRTPVFLIHDGGGTIFSYACLGPLHRQMYGIHNPHFYSGEDFEGGIAEMARLYLSYIRAALQDPELECKKSADGMVDILLGGWSLGGLLSLEVAKLLADEPQGVRVKGLLMVDSVFPVRATVPVPVAPPDTSEEGKNKNQILAQKAMVKARKMIQTWEPPFWEARPRMVLVRAKDNVPVRVEGKIEMVDVFRDRRMLGWEEYAEGMFERVMDVDGHHFNLFENSNILKTTAVVRKALDVLDGPAP